METGVRTLLGARGLDFSILCLRSLVLNSGDPLRLVVHSDGTLGPAEMEHLRADLGAEVELITPEMADDLVEPQISKYPLLQHFRKTDLFARKILDISLAEEGDRIRYCDGDIIFFDRFSGLFGSRAPGEAMFMKDAQSAYAFAWNFRARQFFPLPESLNSGLVDFPKAWFDLDHLTHVLGTGELRGFHWWREQTLWAALARGTRNVWPEGLVIPSPGDPIGMDRAWHLVAVIRDSWSPALLRTASDRPLKETVRPFIMRPFRTTSYARYLSQRSKNSLLRRMRGLLPGTPLKRRA